MASLAASELILNEDGSIYHLNLLPDNITRTIITVGDPDRVEQVTKYFDKVEFITRKREFHTQTGTLNGKRITVISTGIGTDNIDIVLNELDALVNIDLKTRKIRQDKLSLDIVRIGTSGAIREDIPVGSFLLSEWAVGFDSLMHYYQSDEEDRDFLGALEKHFEDAKRAAPYVSSCDNSLSLKFSAKRVTAGITATNSGFYGPQGRILRLGLRDGAWSSKIESFSHQGKRISNLEMETAGIYGLAKLLGHRAVSLNAIIANRATGRFSIDPVALTDELIRFTLERLAPKKPI